MNAKITRTIVLCLELYCCQASLFSKSFVIERWFHSLRSASVMFHPSLRYLTLGKYMVSFNCTLWFKSPSEGDIIVLTCISLSLFLWFSSVELIGIWGSERVCAYRYIDWIYLVGKAYGWKKKWAKGKYPFTSVGSIRINPEITNHRGNSTVPCFQHCSLFPTELLLLASSLFMFLLSSVTFLKLNFF